MSRETARYGCGVGDSTEIILCSGHCHREVTVQSRQGSDRQKNGSIARSRNISVHHCVQHFAIHSLSAKFYSYAKLMKQKMQNSLIVAHSNVINICQSKLISTSYKDVHKTQLPLYHINNLLNKVSNCSLLSDLYSISNVY